MLKISVYFWFTMSLLNKYSPSNTINKCDNDLSFLVQLGRYYIKFFISENALLITVLVGDLLAQNSNSGGLVIRNYCSLFNRTWASVDKMDKLKFFKIEITNFLQLLPRHNIIQNWSHEFLRNFGWT